MLIRVSLSIAHDATDPTANDATLDLSALIVEKLTAAFGKVAIYEQNRDTIIIAAMLDVANTSQFRVTP